MKLVETKPNIISGKVTSVEEQVHIIKLIARMNMNILRAGRDSVFKYYIS
jgi:hypothetical protein